MLNFDTIDLKVVATALTREFPAIKRLILFGSRRHRTRSLRSDIDLLLEVDKYVRPSDIREFASLHFPIVDPFILESTRAVSCMNDSFIEADDIHQIVALLQGVVFWTREKGLLPDADIDFEQRVAHSVLMVPTILPDMHIEELQIVSLMRRAEINGMPIKPYLGTNALDAAAFLIKLMRRLIPDQSKLKKDPAKRVAKPQNELEFQDLFWLAVKPWLPGLAREEITIVYDGQDKIADFNYAGSQIIIEFKHVKDANTKAAVVKTLSGLSEFYRHHANVRVVIFAILDSSDSIDVARWEDNYSYRTTLPWVLTVVIPCR